MELKDTALKGGGGILATLAAMTPFILSELNDRDKLQDAAFETVTRLGELKEAYGNHIKDLQRRLDRCEQR